MDAIELLETRASNIKLVEPAPTDDELRAIVAAALRAPDHAALRPWRVIALRGAARERLGATFRDVAAAHNPDADAEMLDRAARKPLRAPLMIVVAAAMKTHPKVPDIEQVLSAGAVAHGILLGLQARGFAGSWRTGKPTYDARVNESLGLRADDRIVGFLYAGTPDAPAPDVPRPNVDDFLEIRE